MNKYIGLIMVSILACWGMGTWAFVFFLSLKNGQVIIHEPSAVTLWLEFAIACLCTLVGIFVGTFAIIKLSKAIMERMQ